MGSEMNKVYRDSQGNAVHIGEWDYCYDVDNKGKKTPRNPLPVGYVESTAKTIRGWDGGLYLEDDPRQHASK